MCVYRRMGIVLLISCMVLVLGSCGDKKADMTEVADRVEKMVTGNNPLQVKTVSQDKYAYNTLDDATKLVYDEILYAIVHRKKEVQIATTDVEQMELAYLAVRYDYCDLFWLKQFSYVTYSRDDEITAIEITPEYSMTAEEQKKTQKAIDKEADRMLADAPKEGSDYEKALYVFEKLIDEVDYVEDSADNQNIISVFLNHETICQGYAYATQYLLEKLGVSCTTVIGNVSDGHACMESGAAGRSILLYGYYLGQFPVSVPTVGTERICAFQICGLQLFRGYHSRYYAVPYTGQQDSAAGMYSGKR